MTHAPATPEIPRLGVMQQRMDDARHAADAALAEYERVLSAHAAAAAEAA